jgi:hypothetical protein
MLHKDTASVLSVPPRDVQAGISPPVTFSTQKSRILSFLKLKLMSVGSGVNLQVLDNSKKVTCFELICSQQQNGCLDFDAIVQTSLLPHHIDPVLRFFFICILIFLYDL